MNVLDNSIETVLSQAGLSQSERKVYMAASLNQAISSSELVRVTRMPRATVLAALKTLRNFGLCAVQRRDGRSYVYIMQPVQNLKSYVGQQARQLDQLIETIDTIALPTAGVVVREASGQEALMELLELALRCQSREWQIIAPHDNALRYLPKEYTGYFKRIRHERQIQSQTLWEAARKGQKVNLRDVLMRKPRYVPEEVSKQIPSIMLAFDDKLLVIDGTTDPSAVLLQSRTIAATFRIVFEMAWLSVR